MINTSLSLRKFSAIMLLVAVVASISFSACDKASFPSTGSCLYFGSYPMDEVVAGPFTAVDRYALDEGDVIVDAALYAKLEQVLWNENDDAEMDGKRYHRLRGEGAVTAATDREQHYRWKDLAEWHYFAYSPIQWRVLKISGSKALLLADRMPDTHPFHEHAQDIDWSRSELRRWLNDAFMQRAFSKNEQAAILDTRLENAPNAYFGTPSGPDTQDKVFILSGNEVFNSPMAADYGFYPGNGVDDPARRFRSTLYAKCRGAWWSPATMQPFCPPLPSTSAGPTTPSGNHILRTTILSTFYSQDFSF